LEEREKRTLRLGAGDKRGGGANGKKKKSGTVGGRGGRVKNRRGGKVGNEDGDGE